jgi:hypothetical protein
MALKDNASLALIPVAYKEDKVYCAIPNDADGDFDFTRGSNGTRVNKGGLIETMPTNTPRLNYNILDGVVQGCPTLLLEPPKINIYTYSEDLSQGTTLANTTVDADSITSPSGALTGNKLTQTSGALTRKNLGVISGAYAWSFFAKKGDLRYLNARSLFVLNGTTPANGNTIIDLDTNTIAYKGTNVTSASIQQYPNDWVKVEIVATDNATGSGDFVDFFFTDNATSTQSTGVAGNGYIWGVQFESGNYGTSYIPNLTTGSTSRSTDAASGAGTSATFNDSEGVLYANISALADDGTYSIISLSDNSSNNFIIIGYKDTTNRLFCDAIIGGTRFVSNPTTIVNQEQFNKICLKYKSGDTDIYFNGFKILSSSTTFTHSGNPISELEFRYFDNNLPFYGKTKEVMTFNEALSDSRIRSTYKLQ